MNGLRDITVLITAAGNVFMPGTTACLRANGERRIRLIGADMNDDPSILQMFDAYYPVPRGDHPEYTKTLKQICCREKVDILLPIMSVELDALAKEREDFSGIGTLVSVSEPEALAIANNKLRLLRYMTRKGLPCAKFMEVSSVEELEAAARELGYPGKRVCVKSAAGSGSRGFRILDHSCSRLDLFLHAKPTTALIRLDEMSAILGEAEAFPELIVMEYLPGAEYTVDLLADHGRVMVSCCRKSLNMENSIMLDGEVVENREVNDLCRELTEMLKLDGNIGFDIREREDGTPLIMECNPRITAGIPVFLEAGVNLPYLNIKRLLKEPLPECRLKPGTIVKRRWQEMAYQREDRS